VRIDSSHVGVVHRRRAHQLGVAAVWRAELVALTDEQGDAAYRRVHLPRTTLEDVLDDGLAPAERRIGAALALRASSRTRHARNRREARASNDACFSRSAMSAARGCSRRM
jgi:hypothetical protein